MEEIKNRIKKTEENIAAAESKGDINRRDNLEILLVELQREKNLLIQEAQRALQQPPVGKKVSIGIIAVVLYTEATSIFNCQVRSAGDNGRYIDISPVSSRFGGSVV